MTTLILIVIAALLPFWWRVARAARALKRARREYWDIERKLNRLN